MPNIHRCLFQWPVNRCLEKLVINYKSILIIMLRDSCTEIIAKEYNISCILNCCYCQHISSFNTLIRSCIYNFHLEMISLINMTAFIHQTFLFSIRCNSCLSAKQFNFSEWNPGITFFKLRYCQYHAECILELVNVTNWILVSCIKS